MSLNVNLNNKITSAAKWSTITEVLAKLLVPITNMILARILVPEAFGVIATITMIISFVEMFSNAGFNKYIIQYEFANESIKEKSVNVAFWTNFIISLFLWVIIIIFKDLIAVLVGNPGLGLVIVIACIQLPLTSFSSIQIALYRREFNFKVLFLVRMIVVAIPFLITIPLAFLGAGYWSLIIGSIIGAITNALILTLKSNWKPRMFYSFTILKNMLSFSIWTMLESLAIWLTVWIDVLLIGNAFNEYYLGLYKNSLNIVNSLLAIVTASVLPVLFSSLSRIQNNEELYQKFYYKTQRLVAYIAFPMGICLFVFSDLATFIMFGEDWLEASSIVGIFGLMGAIGLVFSNLNGEVYRSKGRPKLSFIYQIIHLAFLIPACIIALNYGFWALVYVRALIRLQGTVTGFIFMKFFMGFSLKVMLKNTVLPVVCSVAMGLLAYILVQFSSNYIWSLISASICLLFYVAILIVFAKEDFKGIIKILPIPKKIKNVFFQTE